MAKLENKKRKERFKSVFALGRRGVQWFSNCVPWDPAWGLKDSSVFQKERGENHFHNNTMMDSTIYTLLILAGPKVQVRFFHKMYGKTRTNFLTNPKCALIVQKHWWVNGRNTQLLWQPLHSSHFQYWKQERCSLKRVLDEAVKINFIKPQLLNI